MKMKKMQLVFSTLLIMTLAVSPLAGCAVGGVGVGSGSAAADSGGVSADSGSTPVDSDSAATDADDAQAETERTFSYSEGIDDHGHWAGIKALDYVDEMFNYKGLPIPGDIAEVSEEDIQAEADAYLADYATAQEITNRAAQDGDTLNIDYVGTINDVAFEGGSTEGAGTDIIIGETEYIDDFIAQLIGHHKGDSFDITVTFPEDYGQEELNGKDAVFAITINSISETVTPELTDAFVAEKLAADHDWKTVNEMKEGISKDLRDSAIRGYIETFLSNDVTVSEIPDTLIAYQKASLVDEYNAYAEMYGVKLEDFLSSYVGVTSIDEVIAESQEDLRHNATLSLAIQAVAEDAGITVTDEDLSGFFLENMDSADYTSYEEEFGLPYLKQMVLTEKVLDLIVENAVIS